MDTTKIGEVYYISRSLFEALVGKKYKPEDIPTLHTNKKISNLTREELLKTNEIICHTLFNSTPMRTCETSFEVNEDERSGVLDKVKQMLTYQNGYCLKCCDIVPLSTSTDVLSLLVVVESGFLRTVTETKEKLEEHFLTLLRHFYDHRVYNWTVRREYIGLKLFDGRYGLVKVRLDRVWL